MTRFQNFSFMGCAVIATMALVGPVHAAEQLQAGYTALDHYVAPAVKESRWFAAPSGASLHETLNKWAAQAGWKAVAWKLPEDTDFTLGQARRFEGGLEQAAKSLIDDIGSEANLQLHVDTVNHILTVTAE